MADDRPGVVVTSPDPTENVRELVVAANLRSDDLRKAEATRVNDAIQFLRLEMGLRAKHTAALAEIERRHSVELRAAESGRLDAIRTVDVNATAIAAAEARSAAQVLANQLTTTADNMRALVTSAADRTNERIAELERAKYEGTGKSAVADPALAAQLAALSGAVEKLGGGASEGKGRAGIFIWFAGILSGAVVAIVMQLLQRFHG